MKLQELPDWLREIAYERCKANSGQYAPAVIEKAKDLRGLFQWCPTIEGDDFWRTIHEKGILPTREEYKSKFGTDKTE